MTSEPFSDIYERDAWGGKQTRSGPGSDDEATARIRPALVKLLDEFDATGVLDVGCGEGSWMPDLGVPYLGIDVVGVAVSESRRRHPDRSYRVLDGVHEQLPHYDVVLCRDVMMHLPLMAGMRLLRHIEQSGARVLVATTFADGGNTDVAPGDFFPIDLQAAPFDMGAPIAEIADDWRHPRKELGAWLLRSDAPVGVGGGVRSLP